MTETIDHEVKLPLGDGKTFRFNAQVPVTRREDGGWSISHKDLGIFERKMALKLAELEPMPGPAFKYIRKSLGYSLKQVTEAFEVGPETLKRWEDGRVPIPHLIANAVRFGALCAANAFSEAEAHYNPESAPSSTVTHSEPNTSPPMVTRIGEGADAADQPKVRTGNPEDSWYAQNPDNEPPEAS